MGTIREYTCLVKVLFWLVSCIVVVFAAFYVLHTYSNVEKQKALPQFPDGKHLGFILVLNENNSAMDVDTATWLTGTAAEDAAIRAGLCTEETRNECNPNGFFIERRDEKERISLDPNVHIIMQTWRMEETGEVAPREIDLATFAELINNPSLHWRNLPYTITVENNAVIRIEEVYIP